MERNNDPQMVTIAVEVYQNLLGMADRSRYNTSKIERHVRKMNPHLQAAHQDKVLGFEQRRTARIKKCRDVIEQSRGKVVYVDTSVNYSSKPLVDRVLTPMQVKCINAKARYLLDLYPERTKDFKHYDTSQVTPDSIYFERPEDYYQITSGVYRTLWVKRDSPLYWYSIEEDAYKEDWARGEPKRREEATNGRKLDAKRLVANLQDVIGER